MKLNEISQLDSEDLQERKFKFKMAQRFIAQIKKTQKALDKFVLESNRLGSDLRLRVVQSAGSDTDLLDLFFDIENARSSKEQEIALDKMVKMIKAGDFEVD